ncbi:hypothetical protein KIN20_031218 [Parelaphostrongylus tenuis]|uniref:Uncharacterized protein n=1 Tax=Parelaphostrongylus tenuis TaxID=148309 RepID=A0AAD5R560_PARTN|nr:hypothetical protein KIN20_031218 [Parelaphostrongylus tenuis]
MFAMLWRLLVAVMVISWLTPKLSLAQLPVCTRVQACSAHVNEFPLADVDSSGWGSGDVPVYDEVFNPAPFDYSQTPEATTYHLCECANNQTCDSEKEERIIHLDEIVRLTFCENVHSQLPLECKGTRGLPRVIGIAHPSGEAISVVSSTAVFCTCPFGYERLRPEYWSGSEISISYKCKRTSVPSVPQT